MVRIELQFFAGLRERMAADRLTVELPIGSTVRELRRWLTERRPEAAALLNASLFAVNDEYVAAEECLAEGMIVAVIPPVSGG